MKAVGLVCAVVLLLPGCTNGALRQPRTTPDATPPAAVSAPKPRPTAPAAAEPVSAPPRVPEPTQPELAAAPPPAAASDPAPQPGAPAAAVEPASAPPSPPKAPQPVDAASTTPSFTPIREARVGTCDCPYDLTSTGIRCGGSSDWSRPGGRDPLCYLPGRGYPGQAIGPRADQFTSGNSG